MSETGVVEQQPFGHKVNKPTNLRRDRSTITSMPGYVQPAEDRTAPCPRVTSPMIPSTIKITLYSMTDAFFARSMIAASKRCVKTQILMNDHLSAENDAAWRILQKSLGMNR